MENTDTTLNKMLRGSERLRSFLGLNRNLGGLLFMVILVGTGEKMAERFLPIYLMALGGGALTIGLLNGLDNLLSALYSFPGGYLSDRFGTKRALLIFNLMAMTGFLIVILIPVWQAIIIGACFFLSWTAISLPASMSLVAKVLPKNKRTMGVSMHSMVRRIPMAIGPLLGGACIGLWGVRNGVRVAFGVALLMAAIAIVFQETMLKNDEPDPSKSVVKLKNPFHTLREAPPALWNLLISDILVRFCEQIPYPFVVLWCMKTISSPITAFHFGILTTIEMVTAMLIYIPVAWLADRSGKKIFVALTFVFFTIFPVTLMFCQSFWPLAAAFVLRGLKEFGEPTRKALIMDLAPEGRKAATFGSYYLVRDVIVSVAAFGGAFLWMLGPRVNFVTATAFGAIGTIWFIFKGRDLTK